MFDVPSNLVVALVLTAFILGINFRAGYDAGVRIAKEVFGGDDV